jgi:beta-glucosidase
MNARNLLFASSFSLFLTFSAQGQVYQKIENKNGPALGYSTTSGVKILSIAGNKFKDLNRNGKLDRYEDWRLTPEERAKDLASKLSVDQIAGLMLYSRHQALPASAFGFMAGTYSGKNYQEGMVSPWALTDQQR